MSAWSPATTCGLWRQVGGGYLMARTVSSRRQGVEDEDGHGQAEESQEQRGDAATQEAHGH